MNSTAPALKLISSGYKGDVASMTAFLECWRNEIDVPPRHRDIDSAALAEPQFDTRVPKSARDFFLARRSIGFESLYEAQTGRNDRYVNPTQLSTLREFSASDYAIWERAWADIDPPVSEYYRYDRHQSGFRSLDLPKFLVLGHEHGGAFYLINPDEKTLDGESETLFLHHGGLIYRVRSFGHLLANLYLEEREKFSGRDPSLGNLYYFDSPLSSTCIRHIIDV